MDDSGTAVEWRDSAMLRQRVIEAWALLVAAAAALERRDREDVDVAG